MLPPVREGIPLALTKSTGGKVFELTDETNIVKDLGLDSLAVMDFIMQLEDDYDISIPQDRIAQVETVGELVAAVEAIRSR